MSQILDASDLLLQATYTQLQEEQQRIGNLERAEDISHDLKHVRLVRQWVLKIDRSAAVELQVAALFHDIERAYRIIKRANFDNQMEYKMAHARKGAEIAIALLRTIPGIEAISLDRVSYLISFHEDQGEGDDLITLRDADAIAFLVGDTEYYERRKSLDILQKKITYSISRLSDRGRSAALEYFGTQPQTSLSSVITCALKT